MPYWYHVAPLFHLPNIVERGGLICGADVTTAGLPRRESSRDFDDETLAGLNGNRVADCVLLYQKRGPMNNLLVNKIRGNRKKEAVWRCYPNRALGSEQVNSGYCLFRTLAIRMICLSEYHRTSKRIRGDWFLGPARRRTPSQRWHQRQPDVSRQPSLLLWMVAGVIVVRTWNTNRAGRSVVGPAFEIVGYKNYNPTISA